MNLGGDSHRRLKKQITSNIANAFPRKKASDADVSLMLIDQSI